ncbi:MAG: hypothetical protein MI739_13790 [Bacteroidales bacterium]|nr:hypothetical protein [Bacteroidales bacterium]
MRNILIIFTLLFCSTAFGQQYILEQVSSDYVAKFEKKFESTLEEQDESFSVMLSPQLYPMVAEKNLGKPYSYERKLSDFRVPAICEYYFDKSGDTLWYTMISWRATNGVSIFDFAAKNQRLIEEISHKDEYIAFFKKLNDQISVDYGTPNKRTDKLVNVGENTIGEKVTWETDKIKIVSEIQMPKESEKEFLRVSLMTYWK